MALGGRVGSGGCSSLLIPRAQRMSSEHPQVRTGEVRRTIGYYEQHLALAREVGDRQGEGNALGNLGIAYEKLGEPERAIAYYEQALDLARAIGDRRGEARHSWNLGLLVEQQGDP